MLNMLTSLFPISVQSRVPVILSHWGSGTSFKNFVHFGQVRLLEDEQLVGALILLPFSHTFSCHPVLRQHLCHEPIVVT